MRRPKYMCFVAVIVSLVSGCSSYQKEVRDALMIDHVFARPTTAYGPGSVVMYTKHADYTGVCLPEWWITTEQPKDDATAVYVKTKDVKFDIKLSAEEKQKLGSINADLSRIRKFVMKFDNGRQSEIYPLKTYNDIISEKRCAGRIRDRLEANPDAKFYFTSVDYKYDMTYEAQDENGMKISVDLPEEALKVIAANIDMNMNVSEQLKISGNNLYIGFNGDPLSATAKEKATGINLFSVEPMTGYPLVDLGPIIRVVYDNHSFM